MVKKLKENWFVFVVTMLLTLFGNLAFYSFKTNDSVIRNSASKDYVDDKDTKVRAYIDKHDAEIKDDVNSRCNILKGDIDKKADKDDMEKMQQKLDVIDSRIYDLWKDRHENN